MPTFIKITLISIAMFSGFSAYAADLDCGKLKLASATQLKEARAKIEQARVQDKIPALAFSIFTDSCLLESGALGSIPEKSLSPQTSLFRLASVSKLFTSISIVQLIEKGLLSFDTPIMTLQDVRFVRFLKEHETAERLAKWNKITIRQLLSHTSGISKDIPGALVFFNTESLKENSYPGFHELYRGLTSVEFLYEAGERLKYSNLGMNLLARIVKDLNTEHLSYPQYVQKNIFQPLGMEHSHYDLSAAESADLVPGFGDLLPDGTRTSVPLALKTGSYDGSIGVASTAEDLAKFAMQLFKLHAGTSGLVRDGAILDVWAAPSSPASQALVWAHGPTWQYLPNEKERDALWLGHTGTGPSERILVAVAPEKNLGVVVQMNTHDANREKYAKIISDALASAPIPKSQSVNQKSIDRARSFLATTPAPQTVTPPPYPKQVDLTKYAGKYFADIPGYQEISISADGYLVFFGQKLEMEDSEAGHFRFPPVPGPAGALFNREPVRFTFDQQGRVTGLRLANVKKFERVN